MKPTLSTRLRNGFLSPLKQFNLPLLLLGVAMSGNAAWAQTTVPLTGSGTWQVPAGVTSIEVKAIGGGGGSGGINGTTTNGGAGGNTTLSGMNGGANLSAGGGSGSNAATTTSATSGVSGGSASQTGGTSVTTSNGSAGTTGTIGSTSTGGNGGAAGGTGFGQGASVSGASDSSNSVVAGSAGNQYGGGASGGARGGSAAPQRRSVGGAGGGAYVAATYAVTPGANLSYSVGTGGTAGGGTVAGAAGAAGRLEITYTAVIIPTQLSFGTQPGATTYGTSVGSFTVRIEDAGNNLATNDNTTQVTISVNSGPGSISEGTVTQTAVNGIATFAGIKLSQAGVYTFQATSAPALTAATSGTFDVDPKPIAGSFTADNKTYDGSTDATVATRSLSDVETADVGNVILTGGDASFIDKNAGLSKTVNLAGATLGGSAAGNYSLSGVASTTADINELDIEVTVDAGQGKIYGNADSVLTYSVTNGALQGSDTFTGALSRGAGETVGLYAVNQGTLAIDDENSGNNYALTFVPNDFEITLRPITITPTPGQGKVVGQLDATFQPFTYNVGGDGLASGDSFAGALARVAGETVGAYAFQLGTLTIVETISSNDVSSNYDVTFSPEVFTINALPFDFTERPTVANYQWNEDSTRTMNATNGRWQFVPSTTIQYRVRIEVVDSVTNLAWGTFDLNGAAGLTWYNATNDNESVLEFSATRSALNARLNGAIIRPDPNYYSHWGALDANQVRNPVVKIWVTDDLGQSNTAFYPLSDVLNVVVRNVNDAPEVTVVPATSLVFNEDQALPGSITVSNFISGLKRGGGETYPDPTLTITLSNGGAAFPAGLFEDEPTITNLVEDQVNGGSADLTFKLNPDAHGTFPLRTVVQASGSSGNINRTFTVNSVNDAPSFTFRDGPGPVVEVDEDSGLYSDIGFAIGVKGPANESGQALTYVVTNETNPGLISGLEIRGSDGRLRFTPVANQYGTNVVTVKLTDSGGTDDGGVDTSSEQTFTIRVLPLNDAPTFTALAPTVLEDFADFATQPYDGNNYNSPIFSELSVGPASGRIESAADASVSHVAQTITSVQVVARTNATLFSGGVDPTIVLVPGGDPSVAADYRLQFKPGADRFGTSTVTVRVEDSGSNGGDDVNFRQATFVITVVGVNDAPFFNVNGPVPVAVLEDAAPDGIFQSVPNFINQRSWGPNEPNSQGTATANWEAAELAAHPNAPFTKIDNFSIEFVSGDSFATLFEVVPFVSGTVSSGTARLVFKTKPDANGSVTVKILLQDNGGTANGGIDTYPDPLDPEIQFTINVGPVNDAPDFQLAQSTVMVFDNVGGQEINDFVTDIVPGPTNESTQTITSIAITSVSDPSLFDVQPALVVDPDSGDRKDSDNKLTFTPKVGANGSATVTVRVTDDGGTLNGGVNFRDRTFTLGIYPVPVPVTTAATSILQGRTTLNGTLDSKGVYTAYVFEYGKTVNGDLMNENTEITDKVQTAAGAQNTASPAQAVSTVINNLESNTTYYYRLVAVNEFAMRRGLILSFTTLPDQWTWDSGSASRNALGNYSSPGTINSDNRPGARQGAVSWKGGDDHLWVFGGLGFGAGATQSKLNDLWSFNPLTGDWVWWTGSTSIDQPGVYPPVPSSTTGASFTPGARHTCAVWTDDSGDLWLFGGFGIGPNRHSDLWRFDVSAKQWAHESGSSSANQSNSPTQPGARQGAVSWKDADGLLWMFGGYGYGDSSTINVLNDLWNYNPATSTWTRVVAGGTAPSARRDAMGWADRSGRFWLFGGLTAFGGANYVNDLYVYDPGTNNWTQVDAGVVNGAGTATQPAARYSGLPLTSPDGALLLVGGGRDGGPFYNDVWQLDWVSYANGDVTNPWVALTTANTTGAAIGTIGVGDPANRPGGRFAPAGMMESNERLWLFSGAGSAPNGLLGRTSDVWRYELSTLPQAKWDEDNDGLDDGWEIANYGDTTSVDVNSIVTGSLTAGDYELAGLTAAPVPDAFPTFSYNEEFGIPFVDLSGFVPDTTKYTAVYDDDPGPVVVEKELTGTVFNDDSPGPVAPSVSGAAVRILDTSRTLLDKPFQGLYLDDAAQRP